MLVLRLAWLAGYAAASDVSSSLALDDVCDGQCTLDLLQVRGLQMQSEAPISSDTTPAVPAPAAPAPASKEEGTELKGANPSAALIAAPASKVHVVVSGKECGRSSGRRWIGSQSSAADCMTAVLAHSGCSTQYFNWVARGDKNCGCVLRSGNCLDTGNHFEQGTVDIYEISMAASANQPSPNADGSCGQGTDCNPGFECHMAMYVHFGSCLPAGTLNGEGESCDNDGQCKPGLMCDTEGEYDCRPGARKVDAASANQPSPNADGSCGQGTDCNPGFQCHMAVGEHFGSCLPAGTLNGEGESCDNDGQCKPGLMCDTEGEYDCRPGARKVDGAKCDSCTDGATCSYQHYPDISSPLSCTMDGCKDGYMQTDMECRKTQTPTRQAMEIQWDHDPNYCLSTDGNRIGNGVHLQVWQCVGSSGQLWDIDTHAAIHSASFLRLHADPSYCVSVDGNHFKNGAKLQLWKCVDDERNQAWNLHSSFYSPIPLGQLSPQPSSQNMCMAIDHNNAHNGARLQTWRCAFPGSDEGRRTVPKQMWRFVDH